MKTAPDWRTEMTHSVFLLLQVSPQLVLLLSVGLQDLQELLSLLRDRVQAALHLLEKRVFQIALALLRQQTLSLDTGRLELLSHPDQLGIMGG